MAENKKEMERAELHRTIWAIADEMRGAVDGWDFKAYILGMLFYRYISENITNYINKGEWDTGNTDFDYATLDDDMAESIREEMVGIPIHKDSTKIENNIFNHTNYCICCKIN